MRGRHHILLKMVLKGMFLDCIGLLFGQY